MKKLFLKSIFIFIFYFSIPLFSAYILYFFHHAQFELSLNNAHPAYQIYDKNNHIIKKWNSYVIYQNLPKHLIDAFVAIEDTRFFSHYGISIPSIFRSLIINIKNMKFLQGGSTITQQLIKIYKGNLKKTIFRKITDIFLALLIETIYSKETIFEAYCNIIYLGKNITGVAQCSQVLFNKEYAALDIGEAAMIAGIVKRPEYYNPLNKKAESIQRRNVVLKRMMEEKFISKNEYNNIIKKEYHIQNNKFYDYNKTIYNHIGENIKTLNLSNNHTYEIYTTVDPKIENKVYNILEKYKNNVLKNIHDISLCALVVDMTTGTIAGIVDTTHSSIKKYSPLYSYHHSGSLIKPIIFYFASIHGDPIGTMYEDAPLDRNTFTGWDPQNHYKKYLGPISGAQALEKSNNIIPIKILHKYNIDNFIHFIQPYFYKKIMPYFSIALGCIETTPFEIALLYYHFFSSLIEKKSNIVNKDIMIIKKIIKQSGGIIYETERSLIQNPFISTHTIPISQSLKKIGQKFNKKYSDNSQKIIYGKTGTTNNATCCWSVCSDLQYLIIVFVGSQNNEKLYQKYQITSANSAMPINIEILNAI